MKLNKDKSIKRSPEKIMNGRYGCPHCKVTLEDFVQSCPVCGQKIDWSEIFSYKHKSEPIRKPDFNKFISYWFEIVKLCMYVFIGVIPGIVFKMYATPGQTYDCIYSLIIWGVLLIAELGQVSVTAGLGQVSVTAYNQLHKEKNDEDKTEG